MFRWIFPLALTACSGVDPDTLPERDWAFSYADNEVGCNTSYNDEKRNDIFEKKFNDHWFKRKGTVVVSEPGSVGLDLNGGGIQDLQVDFEDENAGYNLIEGQELIVRFVMEVPGGCYLPFMGNHARI